MLNNDWTNHGSFNSTLDCHVDPEILQLRLKNTYQIPDTEFRRQFGANSQNIAVITKEEAVKILKSLW